MVNDMDTQATEYERRDATEDDVKTLPHIVDPIPLAVWIALVAGALEGFTYYAVTATMIAAAPVFWVAFRNYDKIDDDELNAARLVEPDSQARWKRLLPGHIYRRDISVAKRFGLRVDNTAMDS